MRTSTSTSDPQQSGRLPVNPRRQHVPSAARKRVAQACNNCNIRRIRCSGEKPCSQCHIAGRSCEYPPVVEKASIPRTELENLRVAKASLERCLSEVVNDSVQRQNLIMRAREAVTASGKTTKLIKDEDAQYTFPSTSSSSLAMSTAASSPSHEMIRPHQFHLQPQRLTSTGEIAPTEGSLLQDRDGTKRWLGGTSGATFLDHLKKFMHTLKSSFGYNETPMEVSPGSTFLASRGQYQTSDSRILFMPEAEKVKLFSQPDWDRGSYLLAKVNKYVQDCMGKWPCGGIYYFGDLSPQSWVSTAGASTRRRRELAFSQAAFALGTVYSLTAANSRRDGQLGEVFFATAREMLGDPMNISLYSARDLPALALMAMYMTEMNRRDNAYNLLTHAMSICCMFGGLKGLFNDERNIRVVWTLFCLTRDASCLMGRPPLFTEGAFQLPLPTAVPGLPPPDGLIAHISLSKIAEYIVCHTYSIAPHGLAFHKSPVAEVVGPLGMLERWREGLPLQLQIPLDLPPEPQMPLEAIDDGHSGADISLDRALCTLHMKYNQLIILVLRPLFFLAAKSYIGGDLINEPRDIFQHQHIRYIQECSHAARRNLRLGRHVYKRCNPDGEVPGKLVMTDLHHIFNAAVVLLLNQMVFINIRTSDSDGIRFARQIFEREAQTECISVAISPLGVGSGATAYGSDCLGVLNDLTALVAHIRPLRFKGSEHVNTGVDDVGFGSPLSGSGFGGDGTNGGTRGVISEDELAANLGIRHFGGFDDEGGFNPNVVTQDPDHTNQKELQRWVEEEALWGANGTLWQFLGP